VQALALRYVCRHRAELAPGVHAVPAEIDDEVARLALKARGAKIDELTPVQLSYLNDWREN
jgi:adenosylhomocysteinase